MKKQRFLIEVESKGLKSEEVKNCIERVAIAKVTRVAEQYFFDMEDLSKAKQYDIKKIIPGPYGSGHQPFKELYPKIGTELNKIRRELIIQALEEVLPGLFNVTRYEQDPVVHSRYVAVILNAKGIKIKHLVTDAAPAMPSDICCIYQDETPIHFFNYL